MKKRIVLTCGLVIGSIVLAVVAKGWFGKSNLARFTTIEDIINSEIVLSGNHVAYESEFCGFEEYTAQDMIDMYIEYLSEDECLYIVKPTGNIRLQAWILMQEVVVEEVIYGDDIEGQTFYIINQGGRIETTDSGVELMTYALNLMQPDNEYLLFCDYCEISDYSDELYYMHFPSFFYFSLDEEDAVAVVYEEGRLYRDYPECDFFVESEVAAEAAVEFKEQIVQYFLGNK